MAAKGKFAVNTGVSPQKSLDEIRQLLKRYECKKFGMIEDEDEVGVAFELRNRRVRFTMPLPTHDEAVVPGTGSNQYVTYSPAFSATKYEQLVRSRWRGLALTIKAKLESVEVGIETFDEAFMAQLVLPSGETVGAWMIPQIVIAYDTGTMPPMLPSGT